jgi:hypothetical protein
MFELDRLEKELAPRRRELDKSASRDDSKHRNIPASGRYAVSHYQSADPYDSLLQDFSTHLSKIDARHSERASTVSWDHGESTQPESESHGRRNKDDLELLAEQIKNVLLSQGQIADDADSDSEEQSSRVRSRSLPYMCAYMRLW